MNDYRAGLEAWRLSPSTINQRLSAIRKLAMEAADNGFMPPELASAISRVKGAKRYGIRTGQRLTREQADRLISAPNAATMKGKRDRALLAVLVGCGLRRKEATALAAEIGTHSFRHFRTPSTPCECIPRHADLVSALQ